MHLSNIPSFLTGVLVHSRIRPVQRKRRNQGVRRRHPQRLRRAPARAQRQARAAAVRARLHRAPALPGPGLPARLLRGRVAGRRQGQVQALGGDHVAPVRAQVQPAHPAGGGPRQRGQTPVGGRAA